MQRALVLCFHSGNERDYQIFPETLQTLHEKRYTVIPLLTLAQHLKSQTLDALPERVACLSFDDGLLTDFEDVQHPVRGHQPALATLMRAHETWLAQRGVPAQVHATSFVIASPEARRGIEQHELLGYPWMTDAWWQSAVASQRLHIANHSLDHLSPSAPRVAHAENVRGDFAAVVTQADATAQIVDARTLIEAIAPNPGTSLFAYPYGHTNRFLIDTFLPSTPRGAIAAFTTHPDLVHRDTPCFEIPRFVCGEAWNTPADLPL